MKKTSKLIFILTTCLFLACSGYGEKLQYQKTELYYTDKVKKEVAEKLGEFLVKTEFANGNEKSIQLSKNENSGNYEFRMVTTKEAAESDTYKSIFKIYAKQISDSVFNKQAVDFHVCDNTFTTLKVIPFETEKPN